MPRYQLLPLLFCFYTCFAMAGEQNDLPLSSAEQAALVNSLVSSLNRFYVFPEIAKKIEVKLRSSLKQNKYANIHSSLEFSSTLNHEISSVSKDKHLTVHFSFKEIPDDPPLSGSEPPISDQMRKEYADKNSFFRKVSWLPGNVGVIKFDEFVPIEISKDTLVAAMTFVANTDVLIFDLRGNHGGHPKTVAFISSYLFGEKPVHLNDIYWRSSNSIQEFWTLKTVPGKRYPMENKVFVLTSGMTFSAAEEFAYNLKNLKRATILGETTGGGANPGGTHKLTSHFSAFIPNGRAINPITHTNWEGTGVLPDVEMNFFKVFDKAYTLALQSMIERYQFDSNKVSELNHILDDLKAGKLSEVSGLQ